MMTDPVKVSVHTERAKNTEKHNDRSQYHGKSPSKYERAEHGDNLHWDCYDMDDSFAAERKFYADNFGDQLAKQNANYIKQGHPERVMDMEEYHKRHMPKETIVSLGDKDHFCGEDWIKDAALLAKVNFEKAGLKVISIDIHFDEGTAHAHIRTQGVYQGKPNISKALEVGGVPTPLERACEELGLPKDTDPLDARYIDQLSAKLPNFYYKDKNDKVYFFARGNNRQSVLTNDMIRDSLETLAMDQGFNVDTVRRHREHESIREYQTRKDNELVKEATAKAKQEQQKYRKDTYAGLRRTLSDIYVEDGTLMIDGEVIDDDWIHQFEQNVRELETSPKRQQLLEEKLAEMRAIIDDKDIDSDKAEQAIKQVKDIKKRNDERTRQAPDKAAKEAAKVRKKSDEEQAEIEAQIKAGRADALGRAKDKYKFKASPKDKNR